MTNVSPACHVSAQKNACSHAGQATRVPTADFGAETLCRQDGEGLFMAAGTRSRVAGATRRARAKRGPKDPKRTYTQPALMTHHSKIFAWRS